MQRACHDDLVAGLADGEAQGLVAVGRAPRRVAAPVGAVPGGGTPLGFRDQAVGQLDRVDAAVEGDIVASTTPRSASSLARTALVAGVMKGVASDSR